MRLFDRNAIKRIGDIQMHDQDSFYRAFEKDLLAAQGQVIIESPFITTKRINELLPLLAELRSRGMSIVINTRSPNEHNDDYEEQALQSIAVLQSLGIKVLYTVK